MAVITAVEPDPVKPLRVEKKRRFKGINNFDYKVSPYIYVAPFYIMFAIFGAFPLLYNVVVALHNWHRRFGQGDFVGMANFRWVLEQPNFWSSLANTFSIWAMTMIPQIIFALLIAALLDQNLRMKTFWRMGVLVPFVVMPVATAIIFSQLMGQFGPILPFMQRFPQFAGMVSPFTQNRFLSHVAIATMVNFRWTGYNALILLSAMQAVPRELYEAAVIDGASRMRQFFSITIPNIRSTFIFIILTMTIGGLQIFDEVRLFDSAGQGGSNNQWGTVVLYLYNLAFGSWQDRLGQAAAVGWILALLVVIFTLINFFLTRSISSGESKTSKTSTKAWKKTVAEYRRKYEEAGPYDTKALRDPDANFEPAPHFEAMSEGLYQ